MNEKPGILDRVQIAGRQHPSIGHHDQVGDFVAFLERFQDRDDGLGLSGVPLEKVRPQREPGRIHQQADLNLRIDTVLLAHLDLPQAVRALILVGDLEMQLVGSARGAVVALLPLRFPGPSAEPASTSTYASASASVPPPAPHHQSAASPTNMPAVQSFPGGNRPKRQKVQPLHSRRPQGLQRPKPPQVVEPPRAGIGDEDGSV